jgi:hypothetical protein
MFQPRKKHITVVNTHSMFQCSFIDSLLLVFLSSFASSSKDMLSLHIERDPLIWFACGASRIIESNPKMNSIGEMIQSCRTPVSTSNDLPSFPLCVAWIQHITLFDVPLARRNLYTYSWWRLSKTFQTLFEYYLQHAYLVQTGDIFSKTSLFVTQSLGNSNIVVAVRFNVLESSVSSRSSWLSSAKCQWLVWNQLSVLFAKMFN